MSNGSNSIVWEEFLSISKHLSKLEGTESFVNAARRSAISCAYYGAFCIARDYALQHGMLGSNDELTSSMIHKKVQDYYKGSLFHDIVKDNLGKLRAARNQADYDNEFFPSEKDVKSKIWLAKELVIDYIHLLRKEEQENNKSS